MYLHFQKSLSDFKYVVCFDLAKYETGISLIDNQSKQVVLTHQLSVKSSSEMPMFDFYTQMKGFIDNTIAPLGFENVLFLREKQPSGHGSTTTIATLQSLAGVHAILDVLAGQYGIFEYEDGIHASSVKAWARQVTGLEKPQKEDIAAYLYTIFPGLKERGVSFDVTDSIALYMCLVSIKWNKDLKEIIKEETKHLKSLKSASAIKKQNEKIEQLNNRLTDL